MFEKIKNNKLKSVIITIALFAFVGGIVLTAINTRGTYAVDDNVFLTYTISFDANEGSNAPESYLKAHGTPVQIVYEQPNRPNHTFEGWGLTDDTDIVSYRPGDFYEGNADLHLYAVWKPVSSSDGNQNGGTSCEFRTEGACEAQYGVNNCTRDSFGCWQKKNDDSNPEEPSIPDNGTVVWVFADANGGMIDYVEGLSYVEEGEDGKQYPQPCTIANNESSCRVTRNVTAIRDGIKSNGWGTTSNCTSGKLITEYDITENTRFFACYPTSSNDQGDNDSGNNGSGGNVSGGNVSGGNVSGGNVSGGNVSGGNVSGNTNTSYTITYDGNGGLWNGQKTWKDDNTVVIGESYRVWSNDNFFVREGYTFTGWKDQNGEDWTMHIINPFVWNNKYAYDITLYAQWEPNNTKRYTVTYDGNGGLYKGSKTYVDKDHTMTMGESYTVYSNDDFFVREGYKFTGWKDQNGEDWTMHITRPFVWKEPYDYDITLYAQWEKINNDTDSDTDKTDEEINTNNKTGDVLIYIVWTIGIGTLGYTIYYFTKRKDSL